METELAAAVAQFGVAGLIGWMWLTERRGAAAREKQLTDAHDRILRDGLGLDALLKALENNTRAMSTMEAAHQRLADAILRRRPAPPPSPPHDGRTAARNVADPSDRYDGT